MITFFVYQRLIPVTFTAADTETVAEEASCANLKQRKRIKLNSESSSPSSDTLFNVFLFCYLVISSCTSTSVPSFACSGKKHFILRRQIKCLVLDSVRWTNLWLSQNYSRMEQLIAACDFCEPATANSWMLFPFKVSHTDMLLQLFIANFLFRVNSSWRADQLDTLRLDQTVKFVDYTEFLRQFVRAKNCRGEDDQDTDDESFVRSWLKWDDSFCFRNEELSRKVRQVTQLYPITETGTVVVKFHDGFDYDSYIAEKLWHLSGADHDLSSYVMDRALGFQKADRLILWIQIARVDSICTAESGKFDPLLTHKEEEKLTATISAMHLLVFPLSS